MIYSIAQLQGRSRIFKVPGSKQTSRIEQLRGGVYPRLIFASPSVIARLAPASRGNLGENMRLPRFAGNDRCVGH